MSKPERPLSRASLHPLSLPITAGGAGDKAINHAIAREAAAIAAGLKSGAITVKDDPAGRYLRENSLTKSKGRFPEERMNQLRDTLANAWDAGGSFEGIMAAIRSAFPDIPEESAAIIVQTEVNTALGVARMATAREAGMTEKHWIEDGTEACDECRRQIAEGWIPIDAMFAGGVMAPCLHEGCDCGVDYRLESPATQGGTPRREPRATAMRARQEKGK